MKSKPMLEEVWRVNDVWACETGASADRLCQVTRKRAVGREDLRDTRESSPDSRLAATNPDNSPKTANIRQAAEVRGLKFGKDAIVGF